MKDFTPPQNTLEDAQIKFQRLCEIANDIEKNGNNSDVSAQQIVISSIISSENEFLFEILENALFDDSYNEYLKTIIAGILWNKKRTEPLIKLVNENLDETLIFSKETAEKESLLLAADAIIDKLALEHHKDALDTLKKLFIASCLEKNDCPLADRLLGRFINALPGKSEHIDKMLVEILKDKNLEINPKLVLIEILTRSKGGDVFEILEEIIFNIKDYVKNQKETLYLLDVITKSIKALMIQGVGNNYDKIIDVLNNIEFIPYQDSEGLLEIVNRIEERIEEINDLYKKVN